MKYFLYARKSTDEDDRQLLSIDAQLEELREHAALEKMSVVREFVEAKTAKKPGRPVFNEMMRRVEKGEADALLAWHPDRLARNSVDGGRVVYLLDTGKLATLKFPSFWFENTPQGKFMLSIAFGQSKYYVDNLSENVKRGFRHKLRLGWFPGRAPIGYLNDPRKRTIVIDEDKGPLVKRLFDTYASGETSYQAIADMANRMGLITIRNNYIRKCWMRRLLSNPFYTGVFRLKGEIFEGSHEPLISRELFDKVQAILRKRSWLAPKSRSDDPCYFVGMLKCDVCGSGVTAQRQKGHHYYNCTRNRGPCDQPKYIREDYLSREIHAALSHRSLPGDVADGILEQVDQWQAVEVRRSGELIVRHEARIAALKTRLDRLLDVYLEHSIEKDEYAARKEVLIREKTSLTAELARIKSKGASWIEPMRAFVTDCKAMGSELAGANAEKISRLARKSELNLGLMKPLCGKNEEAAEAIGGRTPADWTCARLPPGGPEPEGRGGGLAARPATVRTRKAPHLQGCSEVASCVDPHTFPASFASEAGPPSFVFQVSDRQPALRVTYPAPFHLVAAFSALPASKKASRSIQTREVNFEKRGGVLYGSC